MPFPLSSSSKSPLSSKSKYAPSEPKVNPDTSFGFQIVGLSSSYSPKELGDNAESSIKQTSAKYPPKCLSVPVLY